MPHTFVFRNVFLIHQFRALWWVDRGTDAWVSGSPFYLTFSAYLNSFSINFGFAFLFADFRSRTFSKFKLRHLGRHSVLLNFFHTLLSILVVTQFRRRISNQLAVSTRLKLLHCQILYHLLFKLSFTNLTFLNDIISPNRDVLWRGCHILLLSIL